MSRAEEIGALIAHAIAKCTSDFKIEFHYVGGDFFEFKIPKQTGFFNKTEARIYCYEGLKEEIFQRYIREARDLINLAFEENAEILAHKRLREEQHELEEYKRLKAKFGDSNA